MVSFALVVGLGDGVGAQGGEGGGEHGALEPFVAAVGDVLTADRSVGTACDGSESGLGGKVCSGIEGLAWGLRRHQ